MPGAVLSCGWFSGLPMAAQMSGLEPGGSHAVPTPLPSLSSRDLCSFIQSHRTELPHGRAPSWALGICESHPRHRPGRPKQVPSLSERVGRMRNAQSTQRAGWGGQDCRHHRLTPLASSHSLCSLGGDEDEPIPDGGTGKSCKQLGFAHPHVQALFVREGPLSWGQGTRESPCGAGSMRAGHKDSSARRALSLGPGPRRKH